MSGRRVTRFTDKYLAALKPATSRYTVREDYTIGLGLRVHPSGAKTWVYIYKNLEGKSDVMTLGQYPGDLSLSEARDNCEHWRKLRRQGLDPKTERERQEQEAAQRRRQQEAEKRLGTVNQLIDAYVSDLEARGKRSHKEAKRALHRDAVPLIGDRRAKDIGPADIKHVLKKVASRGSLVQANRIRSYLSAAFKYGIYHDNDIHRGVEDTLFELQTNPVRDVPKALRQEQAGDRDLSAEEIAAVWARLTNLEKAGRITTEGEIALKLLLATGGQRSGEIIGATWDEFDLNSQRWEIPGARTKNGKPHIVPLGSLALELLKRLGKRTGQYKHLFPVHIGKRTRPQAVTAINQIAHKVYNAEKMQKFTPRDLRRTCKSRMGELGISKEIRDRLHNHALSDVSSKHYDRYLYLAEKRQAMDKWDACLGDVVNGRTRSFESKIVSISKAG